MTPAGSSTVFSDELARAADAASYAAGGYEDRDYRIAGHRIRVRLAGPPTLQRLLSALDHLRVAQAGEPELVVAVCEIDGEMPHGPWQNAVLAGGAVRGDLPHGGFFLAHDGALTVFDRARAAGYYWQERGLWNRRHPLYPLSPILGDWLGARGVYLVPAAAVGNERGSVLLAGAPGSGKSHAMHACVRGGLRYIGDDACLLDAGETTLLRSVYRTTHASRRTLDLMQHLAPLSAGADWTSAGGYETIFLDDHAPAALMTEAPLSAIGIVEQFSGPRSRVRAATSGDALAALAPWALRNVPGAGQPMLEQLARVVGATPAVHLECGTDPAGIATAVEGLL